MIKISVIIPVYNAERYIEKCLTSIIQQTYSNIEIICINDGSTDSSLAIIENYVQQDSRIKLLSQANQGQSAARNIGIDNANGEYIGFIDADDYVDNDFFEKLLNLALQYDADIAQASTRCVSQNKLNILKQHSGNYSKFIEKFSKLNLGSVWDKIFRKDLIDTFSLRFLENTIWEDNLFVLEAIYHAQIFSICENTHYNYMLNDLSTTQNNDNLHRKRKDSLVIAEKMLKFAQEHSLTSAEISHIKAFILKNIISRTMLYNKAYYRNIKKVLGNSFNLTKKYYSAKFRCFKKGIKNP